MANNKNFVIKNGLEVGQNISAQEITANSVVTNSISIGSIDDTAIGEFIPAAGNFTTLTASGAFSADLSLVSSNGDLSVVHGGTGASTAEQARTNLDVDQAGTALVLAIAMG